MPKDEWGVKRLCPSCATRFYDLNKDPMTCPACGAEFDLESLTQTRSKASRPEKAKAEPVAAVESNDIEEAAVVLDDDDDDDVDVSIDDELLDDDEEDTVDLEEIADVPAEDDDS